MNPKLKKRAAVSSLALAAILAGMVLAPSASASIPGGYFQIRATNPSDGASTKVGIRGMLPNYGDTNSGTPTPGETESPNTGTGGDGSGSGGGTTAPPQETPEQIAAKEREAAAVALWGDQVALPAGKSWSVGSGGGQFAIFDGDQGGYSTDGRSWNVRTGQTIQMGAGELAYNTKYKVFGVANDLSSPNTNTRSISYSIDGGGSWNTANGTAYDYRAIEPSPEGFVAILRPAETIALGKKMVTYPIASAKISSSLGKASMSGGPLVVKPTWYTPLNAIASDPNSATVVVAESGTGRDTNYYKDPKTGTISTVAEAGLGSTGLHLLTGASSAYSVTTNVLPGSWRSVDWVGDGFIAVSSDGATVAKSTDGRTWTQSASNLGSGFTKIVKSGGSYMALKQNATPSSGGKLFASSSDGVNWTQFNLDPSKSWKDIAAENGCFVAVSDAGVSVTTCK